MNYRPLWQTSMERSEKGTFAQKFDEAKKLRSIKLTDTAWNNLEKVAQTNGLSRTDVIEQWARCEISPRSILLTAINEFIEYQQQEYRAKSNQYDKEFSTNTRDWVKFLKFKQLIEESDLDLLGQEE